MTLHNLNPKRLRQLYTMTRRILPTGTDTKPLPRIDFPLEDAWLPRDTPRKHPLVVPARRSDRESSAASRKRVDEDARKRLEDAAGASVGMEDEQRRAGVRVGPSQVDGVGAEEAADWRREAGGGRAG